MMFFANLSIRSKIILAFTVILVFTASIGVFSITRMTLLNNDAIALEDNVQGLEPLGIMSKDAHQMVEIAAIGANESNPALGQSMFGEVGKVQQEYTAQWGGYAPSMDPGQETTDGNNFNAAFNQLAASISQMAVQYEAGNHAGVTDLMNGDIKDELSRFATSIDDDLSYQDSQANGLTKNAEDADSRSILLISVVLSIMVLGTMVVAWLMVSDVSRPIGAMTTAMRRLAQQDMNVTIPSIGRKDEIGAMAGAVQVFKENAHERLKLESEAAEFQKLLDKRLKDMEAAFEASGRDQKLVVEGLAGALAGLARGDLTVRFDQAVEEAYEALKLDFNSAMETLQETMKSIAENTQGVRSGAGEITQASDDLSRRTEQQAASLEETAAALDEITATVRKTAEGATEARNVVSAAKSDAERSGEVVRETVGAMTGIDTSSKQIGNIIGVIDEIAFQTNLLALNAGVEAARAGDAGRGFAVVATEVRALAQRSADAAKEIKTLISASGAQVEIGVKLVGETGKALGRIVEQVNRLSTLVTDIAGSAQEQATGLNEVNTAVNQMDQVTQQNAAMVEQSTAASHSLAAEAEALARLVGQFQVGQVEQRRAPVQARKAVVQASGFVPSVRRQVRPQLEMAGADDRMEEF